jgi:hypothetical protein
MNDSFCSARCALRHHTGVDVEPTKQELVYARHFGEPEPRRRGRPPDPSVAARRERERAERERAKREQERARREQELAARFGRRSGRVSTSTTSGRG